MRTCLIIPPSDFLLDDRVFPSLGILRVAASLGEGIDVLDLSGVTNYLDLVDDYHCANNTIFYGITATTPQLPAATRIARLLRSRHTHLILGGPHATVVNAARKREFHRGKVRGKAWTAHAKLYDSFDCVVAGDGELAIHEAMKGGRFLDADDPKSPLWVTGEPVMPARHLIDLDSYHYKVGGVRATSLIAQLGCPFGCGFCGGRSSPSLRRARMRSPESVLNEVRYLYEILGYQGFMFYDDEMNVNPAFAEMMRGLGDLQRKLGVEFKCRGFIKAELFNREQADTMVEAGFTQLLCGFESGSPRMLKNMNKKATQMDNTAAIWIARAAGMTVKALMSLGHPGESPDTIQETVDWLQMVKPDEFDITIITPYPGSPYYDDAVPLMRDEEVYHINGDKLYIKVLDYSATADYYKGKVGEYKAYVSTDSLSSEELVKLRDEAEERVRRLLKIPYPTPPVNFGGRFSKLGPDVLRRSV